MDKAKMKKLGDATLSASVAAMEKLQTIKQKSYWLCVKTLNEEDMEAYEKARDILKANVELTRILTTLVESVNNFLRETD